MVYILVRLAALSSLALAASAGAQATPEPAPVPGPARDLMDPLGIPRDMQAGNGLADPSGSDLLYKRVRDAADDRAASKGRTVPAKAADIIVGAAVEDSRGKPVGTINSVTAEGAVVATAAGKVMVPIDAFGKNRKGLLLGITKAQFDAAVAGAMGTK